jgi:hypothetical protein
MQFQCLNDRCGKLSAVRSIDWYDGQHITECEHCREWHALQQLPTDVGEPIQFEVTGLINA